jgi:AAA family ATP:ADP antiporter
MASTKQSDITALTFALFAATTMIAHQVAGKATRDALFLSNFDITELPKVVMASAVASMAGVLIMSRLLSHFAPVALVPVVFGISAILFVGEWSLLEYQPGIASVVLYLHMAVFGAILISGFWSVINERFDPHTAKQRVARIAAAATFGGVLGGLLAAQVSALLDVRTMLLFLCGLHLICMVTVRMIGAQAPGVHADHTVRTRSAFTVLAQTRYLQWMAILLVLVAIMAALLDYAFKAEASSRFQDSESLVTFFATFYAVIGVLGFVLQTLLGKRVLQRFGIGITLAVLPAVVAMFGTIGTVFAQLWSMVLLRGGHAVFVNSFFRSAFELLYTPVPPHKKRSTKTIIDVAGDRAGDLLGSGFILLLLYLFVDVPTSLVVSCAVVIAIVVLFVVTRLNMGYINQLASTLRKGAVHIEDEEIVDATTQKILAETTATSEKEFLKSRIAAMHARNDQYKEEEFMDHSARFAAAVSYLSSGDPQRIRETLNSSLTDIRLTPYIIPLLANDEITDDIRTELRWMAPRIIGQLTDALLDPDMPMEVRQRLPGVLEATHNPRSINGLMLGIEDASFNVRYSSARALSRMRARNPYLEIPRHRLFSAMRKELSVSPEEWQGRDRELTMQETEVDSSVDPRMGRAMEHVFTLMTLGLDLDAVQISRQAVLSDDPNLCGTALEYLENVLPGDLYDALVQHLGIKDASHKGSRSLSDILDDLKSVVSTVRSDRSH